MKIKSIISVVLSLLLVFALMTVAFAAEDKTGSTKATIEFKAGDLEFGDMGLEDGLNSMDIDFGKQTVSAVTKTHTAVDGSHTLRVLDARKTPQPWKVQVKMGKFVNTSDATNAFDGKIVMTSPVTHSSTNTPSGLEAQNPLTIDSTATADALVVESAAGLDRGTFDTTWAKESITLTIDGSEVVHTQEGEIYKATMTWTLLNV